tara:strand:+ start:4401 stop:4775 length:375 start_codon:yes stop_codon:yes gene_type:complete
MAYRSHPLFFGGAEFSGGLSMEDRQSLLEQENLLAEERDAKARQFQLDMERERKAQEGQMAELTKRQEADRVAALEQQEQAAAEYATPETDLAQQDKERRRTAMWGALAAGQAPDTTIEESRPE